MKQMVLSTFIIVFALLESCAVNTAITEQIREKSIEQGAVFKELTNGMPTPGFSVLTIQAIMWLYSSLSVFPDGV